MKASKAQIEQRVAEVLAVRLSGAQLWDVREYVREKEGEAGSPWELAAGQKPLSDSQLYRYIARADQEIASGCRASRKKLLRRHRARREYLYGLAVNQGDVRAAASVLRDLAELEGVYPLGRVAINDEGDDQGPSLTAILTELMRLEREAKAAKEVQAVQAVTPTPQLTMTSSTETPHVSVETPTAGPDARADGGSVPG